MSLGLRCAATIWRRNIASDPSAHDANLVDMRDWSSSELAALTARLVERVPLAQVARELDRPYADVAKQASSIPIEPLPRVRKIPRGAGYDKASLRKHVVALWRGKLTVAQYARANGLRPEPFIAAFQLHYPEAWRDYIAARGSPHPRVCGYCEDSFYPVNGNQQFCSKKCVQDRAVDDEYFAGNRKNTVGLRSGKCQLCGAEPRKGLASHHALGKDRDPDGRLLVALCAGCHDLVGTLARRKLADDPVAWEALIMLVLLQRHGIEEQRARVQIETPLRAVA
jgi:hypothetical protein